VTRDQLTQVDEAVGANEAGKTAAQSGAVTRPAVTTRVVRAAVRRSACATGVRRWTGTAVTGDQIRTGTAVDTWPRRALVYIDFTVVPCVLATLMNNKYKASF